MTIGSVSGFWMNGRPSGLPANIEDQLAEARRMQLVDPIDSKISDAQDTLDSYQQFNSQLGDFLLSASSIADMSDLEQFTAVSSDSSVVSVQSDSQTVSANYNLAVDHLAQAHAMQITAGSALTDPDDPALIADDMTMSFYHEGTQYSYSTDANTTLNSLAQAISDEGNGIRATVSNVGGSDSPDYALILKSEFTGGGTEQITTDAAGTTPGVTLVGGTFSATTTQDGLNAQFSVDGVSYTRSTNSVDDVIEGMSFELNGPGTGVEVDVTRDTQAMTRGIGNFVQAFNKVQSFLDKATSYDTESGKTGPLMGSSLANSVEWKMRDLVMQAVPGTESNAYSYLSEIGISFQRDGSLGVDSAKLEAAAVAHPDAVASLFAGDNGVAQRMSDTLQSFTDSTDGMLTYKIESINQNISNLQDDKSEAENNVQNYLDRLVTKYTAMENAIMQYQNMQDSIDSLNESFKAMNKG